MKLSTLGVLIVLGIIAYVLFSPYHIQVTPASPTVVPTQTTIPEEPIFDVENPTSVPRPTATMNIPVIRRTPAVVTAIRSLGRLETVQYTFAQSVIIPREKLLLWGLLKESEVVRIDARAKVTAGVDLEHIFSSAIEIDEAANSVIVHLPMAQIHTIEADEESLRPSQHEASMFGAAATDNLVSFARLKALELIEKQAMESDICQVASKGGKDLDGNAISGTESQIRAILKSLKFRKISIITEVGPCTRAL